MSRMNWNLLLSEEKKVKNSREIKTENDLRSIFDRDYHRIVSCSSFRRMQDKAQVFPLEKYDFVRTRLTHSIEVASLAKSLGKDLVKFIEESDPCENLKYIPVILDCAGLLHDIGNPPFGHFGESAIQDWFKNNIDKMIFEDGKWFTFLHLDQNPNINNKQYKKLSEILSEQQINDFLKFEGNAQTLRNVMKLNYVIDENGLNLSYPLLNTIIKYPVDSTKINNKEVLSKKNGYFYSENEDFMDIVKSTGTFQGDRIFRRPLTYLLEAADDITYLTDDIEDAFNKKKLRVCDIESAIKKDFSSDKMCGDIIQQIEKYRDEAKNQEYKNIEVYIVQRIKIHIQGKLVSKVVESFMKNYEDIMNGKFKSTLLAESSGKCVEVLLKDLAGKYIFNSIEILENEVKGHKIIEGVFTEIMLGLLNLDEYGNSKTYTQKLYQLISDNYRLIFEKKMKTIEQNNIDKEQLFRDQVYYKILLVSDFVCGMTDTYAYDFYQKIQSIV